MCGIEQIDFLLARLDYDLWHERGVVAAFEKRLDAVGLQATLSMRAMLVP